MRARLRWVVILAAALVSTAIPVDAQFGKNKIAYDRFDWKVYPSPHFDVYYYGAEEIFLEDIVSYAESAYLRISKELDHELRFRVPMVVYKTHAEFEQTNITLGEIGEAVGAFAEPIQNRMVLPIDQPPDKLYALIAHELTHIFEYSIFFEGYIGRALRSNPPTWLMEGMSSYLGQDEDNIDRMVMRDAVVNNVLPSVKDLDVLSFLTYRYGHAIFDFIEQEHGQTGLRNFLFEYRKVLLTNNVDKAVKEAFGYEVGEFDRRFNRYLRKKYFPVLLEKKGPDDYGKEIGIKKPGVFTFSPTISPSGELVAALAAPKLELDLVVLAAEDGKLVRNLTKGWTNRYQYLVAEAFSGKRDLSWAPSGDQVAVFARKGNERPLLLYNALDGDLLRQITLPDISECASPAFSPDGTRVAFEGNRGGIVDVFEIDLATSTIRNLTQDDFFDANPWYSPDGKSVLYNRRIGSSWKIFSVDLADPSRKTQLTFGPSSDLQPSYSRDGKTVYFASDRGPYGVFNIHSLDVASGEIRQYTDVVGGCFSPVEMASREGEPYLVYTSFFKGTFRLYRMAVRQPEAKIAVAESTAPPAEAEPFEPPLHLTVDAAKTTPYRLRWDVESPSIGVGVTDNGTFLSNVQVQFADLLGDHRVSVVASSVSTFSNTAVTYLNIKKRTGWGATLYDFRDYYLRFNLQGTQRDQVQRSTGATFFVQYPFSRNYRVEGGLGFIDRSQDYFNGTYDLFGFPNFSSVKDRYATARSAFVGDTVRYQFFGPFQGKRFSIGALYGLNLSSDSGEFDIQGIDGNILEYQADFRAYKQVTRRSVLAWRVASVYNAGERESYYGFGGINQLRGFGFREFFGSRLAWSNLEFRFPLADELRFPVLSLRGIRGFFFTDVGAAWLKDDLWWDPELQAIRTNFGPDPNNAGSLMATDPIKFKFWDSDNHRLQDGRASYGFGFQFLFLGGLQFNWSWSKRLPYTRYAPVFDPDTGEFQGLAPTEAKSGETHMDFYIVYDF